MESSKDPSCKPKLSILDVVNAATPRVREEVQEGDEHIMAEILEIAGILQHKYAMLTDSLSKEGQPLLVLFENAKFPALKLEDFNHSVQYIVDVAREVWKEKEMLIIIDRRRDKWQGVKLALDYLESIPKEKVHKVLILKPVGFFKKFFGGADLSQLQNLTKHKVVLLESDQALPDYVDLPSLPVELGGTQDFNHMEWIEHRTAVERFAITCHKTEDSLKYLKSLFTKRDPLTSIPEIEEIAASHRQMLKDIEDDIGCTKDIAETLETIVIRPLKQREITPLYQYNIDCLNKRTDELDKLRDEAGATWSEQEKYFKQSLSLCAFEQDFGKVSQEILLATSEVTGRVDIGETMDVAEELMKEFKEFTEKTQSPHDDIKELHERGAQMLSAGHFARHSIEVRVEEIDKLCSKFEELSKRRRELLQANMDALLCLQQLNTWCKDGVDLLASQPVDRFQSPDGADKALGEINKFMTNQKGISLSKMNKLPSLVRMLDNKVIEDKVKAALKRMEEVKEMFSKREGSLKRMSSKPERPVQPVMPHTVGKQETTDGRSRVVSERPRRKSDEVIPNREKRRSIEIVVAPQPQRPKRNLSLRRSLKLKKKPSLDEQGEEAVMARKMRQVVKELLETEYDYVEDLQFVVEGYHERFDDPENDVPYHIRSKKQTVFGNIVDIYKFHQSVFLKELKSSDGTSSSIGQIFTRNKESFQLYEIYCRNKPASEGLRSELRSTQYVKYCQSKLGHQLPLDSYLLKPVQRITKYQLLIGEMMKYTNKKSSAYQDLVVALDTMKVVLRHLNDVMHSSGLVGYVGNLNDLGKLILQDTFVVWEVHKNMLKQISNLRGKHRQVFLYENAIVLSKKELQELESGKEAYVYQFKDRIDIHEFGLTEHVKGDPCKFELTVKRGKEIHVLQAKSADVKQGWIEEIRGLLFRQLDIAKEKVGLRSLKTPILQAVNYESSMGNSAPNIPTLLSPETDLSSHSDSPTRKFSFNNAISTPKLEQSLDSLGSRRLSSELRSSSDNPLWTGDDNRPTTVYLSPAAETEGESDDGLWSDNEFDYGPDEFDDEVRRDSASSDADRRSQGSLKSRELYAAVADYVAVETTELSFQVGDILELAEYGEEGWWFVESTVDGKQGWVPASYLEPHGKRTEKVTDGVITKAHSIQNGSTSRLETTV